MVGPSWFACPTTRLLRSWARGALVSPPFIRSGQNHLARHSERGMTTRQIEEMDRPVVRQVPEGKMEETGCKIIFGVPMTLAVKGWMMMMMMMTRCTLAASAERYQGGHGQPLKTLRHLTACCTLSSANRHW